MKEKLSRFGLGGRGNEREKERERNVGGMDDNDEEMNVETMKEGDGFSTFL